MAGVPRSTAILRIVLPGKDFRELLALDVQRKYSFDLTINGKAYSGGNFYSPLGDERWSDLIADLRIATGSQGNRRITENVRDAGRQLYRRLTELSHHLSDFLRNIVGPRRLVIESQRAEIHQLPWEAMVDENWRLLAELDVSIVHSSDAFDLAPETTGKSLLIQAIFGPGTDSKTAQALGNLEKEIRRHRSEKLQLADPIQEGKLTGKWFQKLDGDVIHIEAHGDPESGETDLPKSVGTPSGSLDPNQLALGVRGRKMVLLWSCYSAAQHSWGTSVAESLHQSDNTFVLGFATLLRYESSATLAGDFYRSVFTDLKVADPETAILKQRAERYKSDLDSCEWASMILWLRHPLDTAPSALEGPRLPQGSTEWTDQSPEKFGRLAEILSQRVVPGRTVLLLGEKIQGPLPAELFKEYEGPVVHLRGTSAIEDNSVFEQLGVSERERQKAHPGDRFLVLLDTLGGSTRSLLMWSGIGEPHVRLLGLLMRVPDRLAIVLVSPKTDISADPSIVVCEVREHTKRTAKKPTAPINLKALIECVEQDRFLEAVQLFETLRPQSKHWSKTDRAPFFSESYWALIRTGKQKEAEWCVGRLAELNQFEASLIEGNLLHRKGLYREALDRYSKAEQLAQNDRDRGRCMVEKAYVAWEVRDAALAETLHVKSIQLLEAVPPELRDSAWSSAFGRALRDFADGISQDRTRASEAEALLRRAMAIHAIDGRLNQVAAVLQSRGKLACTLGNDLLAEQFLQTAGALLLEVNNRAGWAYTAWWLARLAAQQGKTDQALAILRNTFERLKADIGYPLEKGRIALELSRSYWSRGDLQETAKWLEEALRLLPLDRRQERKEAAALARFCGSLREDTSPTREKTAKGSHKVGRAPAQ